MLAFISLFFILSVTASLEADSINIFQAILWECYGLVMFYHTSKIYWGDGRKRHAK